MFDKFMSYIQEHQLMGKNSNILLAVSGGIDSVFLLDLMKSSEFNYSIAHCNFKLRGKESDRDENFVSLLAKKSGIKCHVKKFNTSQYAIENSLSVQEAARNLRYSWFNELCVENDYDCIATAHHADDLVETILFNLVRGTGIAGLHGILPKRGKIIRPILFATRTEVERYASSRNLKFVEDSSNSDLKYSRNRMRKNVIPEFKKMNPAVIETISKHAGIISDVESILDQYCDDFLTKNKIKSNKGDEVIINIQDLTIWPGAKYLLFRILNPYGFNTSSCADIFRALNARKTGEVFYSMKYKVLHDRDHLIIQKSENSSDEYEYKISSDDDGLLMLYGSLEISKIEKHNNKPWDFEDDYKNHEVAYLNADLIKYPLTIRTWRKGDKFRPLGMNGKKLISDFFTDIKIPSHMKGKTYLVQSGADIIWIAGYRIDDRYKILPDTKEAVKIKFLNLP